MKRYAWLLTALLSACNVGDNSISAAITAQFDASQSALIDLRGVGPAAWQRLCILKPYSSNAAAEKLLGFPWNADRFSSIGTSDQINLLVFIHDKEVLAFTDHPRDKGDFLTLTPQCLPREKAILARQINKGRPVQLMQDTQTPR